MGCSSSKRVRVDTQLEPTSDPEKSSGKNSLSRDEQLNIGEIATPRACCSKQKDETAAIMINDQMDSRNTEMYDNKSEQKPTELQDHMSEAMESDNLSLISVEYITMEGELAEIDKAPKSQFEHSLDNSLQFLKGRILQVQFGLGIGIYNISQIYPHLHSIFESFYQFTVEDFTLEEVRSANAKISELLAQTDTIYSLCSICVRLNGEDIELADMYDLCIDILVKASNCIEDERVGQKICASFKFLELMKTTLTAWYTPHMKKELNVG